MKSKTKFWFAVVLIALVSAFILLVSCKKDEDKDDGPGLANWTVMMYGDGNNNLDTLNNSTSYVIQDAQDMEKVGTGNGLNIIAMISSVRSGGQAKYYKIGYFPNENPGQISSEMLQDKGTKDMSDPATLREFIDYCKANYPAQKYLLVIDDHGAGWPGSCNDDLNGGGGLLTMPELRQAIATSQLQRVDVITFHACLMAMVEVCYELKNVASYVTACQFTMPMQNILGADIWLQWMKDNGSANAEAVARKIAESVRQRAEFKQKTSHYAMINLAQMDNIGSKVGNLGTILVTEAAQYWGEVQQAWNQTHSTQMDNPAYVDIREFANKVLAQQHLNASNLIRTAAQDVISAVNAAVPYTATYFHPPDQPVPRGGLNIHFPYQLGQFDSTNYAGLQFRVTNWHSFLSTWLRAGQPQDPIGRCCYNNNNNCADVTQAQCAGVGGQWTQGLTCAANPCQGGGGGNCPLVCNQARQISLGQTINDCAFSGTDSLHWFYLPLPQQANYRFELCGFSLPTDYDLYVFGQCGQAPLAGSVNTGCEDTVWTASGTLIFAIHRYNGSGSYLFRVSQAAPGIVGTPLEPKAMAVTHNKRTPFLNREK